METKAGYKSTEFWLVVLANVINTTVALQGSINPQTYMIITTGLNCLYAVLRTLAKNPDITTIIDNKTITGLNSPNEK